jgi:hypothetical protein
LEQSGASDRLTVNYYLINAQQDLRRGRQDYYPEVGKYPGILIGPQGWNIGTLARFLLPIDPIREQTVPSTQCKRIYKAARPLGTPVEASYRA